MIRLRGSLTALLLQAALVGPAAATLLEYVYIEANAGSSAGGHGALRIGDDVFDFQNHRFDTLRLRRTRWEDFRYLYSVLENRTLHVARMRASEAQAEALRDRFNRRFLEDESRFARVAAHRRDRVLLTRLAEAPTDDAQWTALLALRGAGFFYGPGAEPRSSTALARLRERVAERHGADFLDRRRRGLAAEIEALPPGPGLSLELAERSLQLLALRALEDATSARPALLRSAGDLGLVPHERDALRALADRFQSALVALFDSDRPDWGYPALLGMARLEAIAASLREDRWVVLDAHSERAGPGARSRVRSEAYLSELLANAARDLDDARRSLAATDELGERSYARLEDTANRLLEVREARDEGRPLRLRGERWLPAPQPVEVALPRPAIAASELERAATRAAERERSERADLREELGYHLVERNCITELLALLGEELGPPEGGRATGRGSAAAALDFVPAVSYRTVVAGYPVEQIGEVPSLRRTRMAEQYARENDLRVYLRESNTLTSTIYRPNEHDAFFLFFTDDAVAPRPVFGALNVVAGAGQAAVGVLRAPFDRGATLWSGLKGIAFSLPELFFVNLRKGVLEYAPADPPRTVAHLRPHPLPR